MAENEKEYLAQCKAENICPTCHKIIVKNQGGFCSWDCEINWKSGEIKQRQKKILEKKENE